MAKAFCRYCNQEGYVTGSSLLYSILGPNGLEIDKDGYCSYECRVEDIKQTNSHNAAKSAANFHLQKTEERKEAQAYKHLRVGQEISHWHTLCPHCSETSQINDNCSCPDCGNPAQQELRHYKDDRVRVVTHCHHCGFDSVVKAIYCKNCNERLLVGAIRYFEYQPSTIAGAPPITVEKHGVIANDPRNITPEDVKIDFSAQPNTPASSSKSPHSRWGVFFVCLLFGVLGVHRFAVGKWFTGLIYLCTLGFFYIGWILDTLVLLLGVFTDSEGRKLS